MEGRKFHVLTDHKPLTFALSSQSSNLSPQRERHLEFIAQFTSDIWYIKGTTNTTADALSLLDVGSLHATSTAIDYKAMAKAQLTDPPPDDAASFLTLSQVLVPTCGATLL